MKLKMDLQREQDEIDKHMKQRFKANKIPDHVGQKLFDGIHEKTKIKRKEKKQEEKQEEKQKEKNGMKQSDFDEPQRTQRIRENAIESYKNTQKQQFQKLYDEGLYMINRRENAWKQNEPEEGIPDINMMPDFIELQKKCQE